MNVLSLFDGMSCGQIALRDMGITPEVYYASEVDKFAIAQTQLNFPDTIQLGDVRLVDPTQLGHIDLLIGGSPCQSFSFAGKRVGMATKENEKVLSLDRYLELKEQGFEFEGQSYLFWEYMRILTELRKLNPNIKFLLENVKMKKEWEKVLTDAIGVEGVHINSSLVSAQTRKRIYWTNIGQIQQPEDRGLLLRDVLQTEVDEKYFLKDEVWKNLLKRNELQDRIGGHFYVKPMKTDEKGKAVFIHGKWKDDLVQDNAIKISRKGEIRKDQDKASCLTVGGHGAGNHSDMDLIAEPINKHLEKNLRSVDDKANCFLATSWKGAWANGTTLVEGATRIRRLTPTECARLQTIPEWYTWQCSETQQYKMLGNGWTVEVIKHIFSYLDK